MSNTTEFQSNDRGRRVPSAMFDALGYANQGRCWRASFHLIHSGITYLFWTLPVNCILDTICRNKSVKWFWSPFTLYTYYNILDSSRVILGPHTLKYNMHPKEIGLIMFTLDAYFLGQINDFAHQDPWLVGLRVYLGRWWGAISTFQITIK